MIFCIAPGSIIPLSNSWVSSRTWERRIASKGPAQRYGLPEVLREKISASAEVISCSVAIPGGQRGGAGTVRSWPPRSRQRHPQPWPTRRLAVQVPAPADEPLALQAEV